MASTKKRWIRNAALAVLVVFIVFVGKQGYHDYAVARDARERRETMQWLNSLIIPKMNFRETSLEEAVAFLNQSIVAAPSRPKDLHIAIVGRNEIAGFHPMVPEEKDPDFREKESSAKITVDLETLPMIEVLKFVTASSNRTFHLRNHVILIHPVPPVRGTFEPVITRTFMFRQGVEKDVCGPFEENAITVDVGEKLRGLGMEFYEGCYAQLDTRTRKLRIRNTEDQISIVDMCADCFERELTMTERVMWWIQNR